MKTLLFTVTIKDCDVDTFRSGGKGGQNQNKVESGVRITHRASGAIGESRETRHQLINKRTAFFRMANTPEFRKWHKIEVARILGTKEFKPLQQSARYVRTVDYPDMFVKDSETGHIRSDINRVMNGDIDSFIFARKLNEK